MQSKIIELRNLIVSAVAILLCSVSLVYADEVTRLACVGDSITAGNGAGGGVYYKLLAQWLGSGWEVKGFGAAEASLVRKGPKPYIKTAACKQALEFNPDILVILLGTNDTKPQNVKFKGDIIADYKALVEEFRKVNPKVKVYACVPGPKFNDAAPVLKSDVLPQIRLAAGEVNAELVDLFPLLDGKSELYPDKLHPNSVGHQIMAAAIYKVLTGKEAPDTVPAQPEGTRAKP